MRLRGANKSDFRRIEEILRQYPDLEIGFNHLESFVVVEDKFERVIAVGTLHKLLEGSFICDKNVAKKERLEAFKRVIDQSKLEAKRLGFNIFHSFTMTPLVAKTLLKHFGFEKGNGENLILKVEN